MLKITFGLIIGACLALAYPYADSNFAAYYSQSIYDCGIRINKVSGVKISDVVIENHKYGFCISETENITFAGLQ